MSGIGARGDTTGGRLMSINTSPFTPQPRRGSVRRLVTVATCIAGLLLASVALTQQQPRQPSQAQPDRQPDKAQPPKGKKGPPVLPGSLTFNTVITKLKEGKQIF